MIKKFLLSVGLILFALVFTGMTDAEATTNPLIGKYIWHNEHFDTTTEIEITEEKFFNNTYRINGILGRTVSMTVFEFNGAHPAEFIVTFDKEDENKLWFARQGNDGEFYVIGTAIRK